MQISIMARAVLSADCNEKGAVTTQVLGASGSVS